MTPPANVLPEIDRLRASHSRNCLPRRRLPVRLPAPTRDAAAWEFGGLPLRALRPNPQPSARPSPDPEGTRLGLYSPGRSDVAREPLDRRPVPPSAPDLQRLVHPRPFPDQLPGKADPLVKPRRRPRLPPVVAADVEDRQPDPPLLPLQATVGIAPEPPRRALPDTAAKPVLTNPRTNPPRRSSRDHARPRPVRPPPEAPRHPSLAA